MCGHIISLNELLLFLKGTLSSAKDYIQPKWDDRSLWLYCTHENVYTAIIIAKHRVFHIDIANRGYVKISVVVAIISNTRGS